MKNPKFLIKSTYNFWRHPVKWIKEIKQRKIMSILMEYEWDSNNMDEKLTKAHLGMMRYGSAIIKLTK